MTAERFYEKILEFEKIEKQKQSEPKKRRWLKTRCPSCGYRNEDKRTRSFGMIRLRVDFVVRNHNLEYGDVDRVRA